jgi:signal transduction histidine kinase
MNQSSESTQPASLIGDDVSRQYLQRVANTFLRIDHIMTTITDLSQLLKLVMVEAEKVVDAETSGLLLYDETTNELYFELALGPKGDRLKEIRLALDQGIAGYAALHREPVNVTDAQNDPRFFKQADKTSTFVTRNLVAVPMMRQNRLIGILEVLNKRGAEHFSDEDVKIMQVLAGQAAIAIENARLFEAKVKSERLAAIGQAIAGLSHYVKNIVTGMGGSASLIEAALREERYDMLPKAWEILKRSNEKVSALVQDMLTYSKEREPQRSDVKLWEMLRDVVDINRQRAIDKGIEICIKNDENIDTVQVDRTGFERCLLNLVNNALDAIESALLERGDESGGVLKIETARLESGTHWSVSVKDSGCGISEDKIQKVFDAFFSTKGSRGTGLGLAVTSKIIHEHGGKIDVQSNKGEGTTFTITMPFEAPAK